MSVYKKLMEARLRLQAAELKKTGHNKFAGYYYFELGDFLPTAQQIFADLGLCGVVSFTADIATLTITDTEAEDSASREIKITSPMGSAALKGCHEVQNVGAVETYQRRYLWVSAFEIVEHDALDATTGKGARAGQPMDGVWESQSEESQAFLMKAAAWVTQEVSENGPAGAWKYIQDQQFTTDEEAAMWSRLDSPIRTALKKFKKDNK